MKTILVDAWGTFIREEGLNQPLFDLLESYDQPKIILTNANPDEQVSYGMVDLPYPLFSLDHEPNKEDPEYYKRCLAKYSLSADGVAYIEHGKAAVKSAESIGIQAFWFDEAKNDVGAVKEFLDAALN